MNSKSAALVTGGSGFLGKRLVQDLLETGGYDVWIYDVMDPSPAISGAQFISGDLTNPESIQQACVGKDVVFHVATAAPTAQNAASAKALMQAVNVDGTRNVIKACEVAKVKRLVVTSSASVVFDGSPLCSVDETLPYADPPLDYYTSTKAQAEELALTANVPSLSVCALRPSAIFGPGDRLMVPTVIKRAKAGKMKYIIGNGQNMFDWTYVDNVTHAHILADQALQTEGSPAHGQAFFINNDEPVLFWGVMGDICEGLGYGRPYIKLPVWLMMVVAVVAVWAGRVFGSDSELTPMRVRVSSVERTYTCKKAKEILGYAPKVDMKTGVARMLDSFPHLHKDYSASKKSD